MLLGGTFQHFFISSLQWSTHALMIGLWVPILYFFTAEIQQWWGWQSSTLLAWWTLGPFIPNLVMPVMAAQPNDKAATLTDPPAMEGLCFIWVAVAVNQQCDLSQVGVCCWLQHWCRCRRRSEGMVLSDKIIALPQVSFCFQMTQIQILTELHIWQKDLASHCICRKSSLKLTALLQKYLVVIVIGRVLWSIIWTRGRQSQWRLRSTDPGLPPLGSFVLNGPWKNEKPDLQGILVKEENSARGQLWGVIALILDPKLCYSSAWLHSAFILIFSC